MKGGAHNGSLDDKAETRLQPTLRRLVKLFSGVVARTRIQGSYGQPYTRSLLKGLINSHGIPPLGTTGVVSAVGSSLYSPAYVGLGIV